MIKKISNFNFEQNFWIFMFQKIGIKNSHNQANRFLIGLKTTGNGLNFDYSKVFYQLNFVISYFAKYENHFRIIFYRIH